jgi:hypothetical protein
VVAVSYTKSARPKNDELEMTCAVGFA